MKKIVLLLAFLSFGVSQAQMTVSINGVLVADNQVMSYNTTAYPQASLDFKVNNNSSSPINVRIECLETLNSDGSGMELCFGNVCLSSVHHGTSYPSAPVTIAPNSMDTGVNHFYNTNLGDGQNYPMDFVFRFYQVDGVGQEVGNAITLTYRYTSTLGLENYSNALSNIGVSLKSTTIHDQIEVNTTTAVQMEMYDLNGKTVAQKSLSAGNQFIDVSNLSAGTYILNFNTNAGQKATAKIIKN
jgi:hypothetical protein